MSEDVELEPFYLEFGDQYVCVYECSACGALVNHSMRHIQWHRGGAA